MQRKYTAFVGAIVFLAGACMNFAACWGEADTSIDPSSVGVRFVYGEGEELLAAAILVKDPSIEGVALADVMETLKDERTFTYTFSQGMLTEINGKENGGSSYWMLYTDDPSMSNTAWGTYEYEGMELGSAILGAESLQVRENGVYVWAYQSITG